MAYHGMRLGPTAAGNPPIPVTGGNTGLPPLVPPITVSPSMKHGVGSPMALNWQSPSARDPAFPLHQQPIKVDPPAETRWSSDEHSAFLRALEEYGMGGSGNEWGLIAKAVGKTEAQVLAGDVGWLVLCFFWVARSA
mmetsp:Transcript_24773/g.38901  ORF Transcript_24773/g.38901 Transcript_24773/m.38901 type:complete len:137 (+) Transcript_24773:93-503(+)